MRTTGHSASASGQAQQPQPGRYGTTHHAQGPPQDDEGERTCLIRLPEKAELSQLVHPSRKSGSAYRTIGSGERRFGVVSPSQEPARRFMYSHMSEPYSYGLAIERVPVRVTPTSVPECRQSVSQVSEVFNASNTGERTGRLQNMFTQSGAPRTIISRTCSSGRMEDIIMIHFDDDVDEVRVSRVEFITSELCAAAAISGRIRTAVGARPEFPNDGAPVVPAAQAGADGRRRTSGLGARGGPHAKTHTQLQVEIKLPCLRACAASPGTRRARDSTQLSFRRCLML